MSSDLRRPAGVWTRREFVRGAAGVMALQHLPRGTSQLRFAYVASGTGSIHVFSVLDDHWTCIQRIPSRAPACLLLSAAQRTLYVSNEVDLYQGLPRGTVEAFRVDDLDGRLTLLGRTPLSLSATRPRHMALSPDGKLLAVAAYGGGLYNLLPIAEDGSLGQASGIFKDTGCGPHPLQASPHPHTLCFAAGGSRLLASDFGSDRLSAFSVEEGRLRRQTQRSTGEGTGPGDCALHPAGSSLYAKHDLESAIACYRYQQATGSVGEAIQRLSFASLRAFSLHPSGRRLYTAHEKPNELRMWHVDSENGMLAPAQVLGLGRVTPTHITLQEESIYLLDGERGAIYKVSGGSQSKVNIAFVDKPNCMVLKTLPARPSLAQTLA